MFDKQEVESGSRWLSSGVGQSNGQQQTDNAFVEVHSVIVVRCHSQTLPLLIWCVMLFASIQHFQVRLYARSPFSNIR